MFDDIITLYLKFRKSQKKVLVCKKLGRRVEKNERVNLRINEKDLLVIKRKATENGLPYQSLINVLIHQYAEGKITLSM